MVFVLLTYPLATTAVIYAAHATKAPKHRGTVADELEADGAAAAPERVEEGGTGVD